MTLSIELDALTQDLGEFKVDMTKNLGELKENMGKMQEQIGELKEQNGEVKEQLASLRAIILARLPAAGSQSSGKNKLQVLNKSLVFPVWLCCALRSVFKFLIIT